MYRFLNIFLILLYNTIDMLELLDAEKFTHKCENTILYEGIWNICTYVSSAN